MYARVMLSLCQGKSVWQVLADLPNSVGLPDKFNVYSTSLCNLCDTGTLTS